MYFIVLYSRRWRRKTEQCRFKHDRRGDCGCGWRHGRWWLLGARRLQSETLRLRHYPLQGPTGSLVDTALQAYTDVKAATIGLQDICHRTGIILCTYFFVVLKKGEFH